MSNQTLSARLNVGVTNIVVPGTSAGLVSANGLPGNTTGSAIASGYVGEEIIYAPTTPIALSTTSAQTQWLFSYTLQPGVWDVYASIQWAATGPNGPTYALIGISTINSGWDNIAYRKVSAAFSQLAGGAAGDQTAKRRFYVAAGNTQVIYFVEECFFNTMTTLSAVSGTQMVIDRVA